VTTTEHALAELKARFGASWQIWCVPDALDGGMTWCARRWDADYRHNLHANTRAELEEYLTEVEAEHWQSRGPGLSALPTSAFQQA
jgi:hypothetical protein